MINGAIGHHNYYYMTLHIRVTISSLRYRSVLSVIYTLLLSQTYESYKKKWIIQLNRRMTWGHYRYHTVHNFCVYFIKGSRQICSASSHTSEGTVRMAVSLKIACFLLILIVQFGRSKDIGRNSVDSKRSIGDDKLIFSHTVISFYKKIFSRHLPFSFKFLMLLYNFLQSYVDTETETFIPRFQMIPGNLSSIGRMVAMQC